MPDRTQPEKNAPARHMRAALAACASPLEPQDGGWRRVYRLPAASLAFAGHFPQRPVLPAVVQCLMAQMTVEQGVGRSLRLCAVPQAKFTAVLEPECDIVLAVRPAAKAGHWDCTLHAGGMQAAKIQVYLQDKTPGHASEQASEQAPDKTPEQAPDKTPDHAPAHAQNQAQGEHA